MASAMSIKNSFVHGEGEETCSALSSCPVDVVDSARAPFGCGEVASFFAPELSEREFVGDDNGRPK